MGIEKLYTLPGATTRSPLVAFSRMAFALLFGCWAVTETTAWLLGWQAGLGAPFAMAGTTRIYRPWQWINWFLLFGGVAGTGWIWLEAKALAVVVILMTGLVGRLSWRSKPGAVSHVHGSARWAVKKEIIEAALLPRKSSQPTAGCYVGGWVDLGTGAYQYLTHNGPEHILAFAPTRSGKGVGLVLPTLLSWRDSAVVHDIKGEAWALTAGWRQAIGQVVIRFSPTERISARFNPLEEVRLGTREFDVGDAQNIALLIVDPEGKGMDDHWAKTGHELLSAAILHVLYSPEVSNKTLRGLVSFFCNPEREIDDIVTEMLTAIHDPESKYGWTSPLTGAPTRTHPMVAESARSFLNKSDDEKSGVQSTAMSYLTLYRDPIVARNTAVSDFRINDLMNHDKPVTLYLVVPPNSMARVRPLIRLLLSQIVRQTTEKMEFEGGRSVATYQHRLLLMLDEFPQLGKLTLIEDSMAFLAGYGLKLFLITQDLTQLYKAYTRDESIVSGCHIRIAYAPNKIETAKLLSEYCGVMTVSQTKKSRSGKILGWMLPQVQVSEQETQRPLLTADECMRLPAAVKNADGTKILEPGDMLIFAAGHNPIYGKQILYFKDPVFDGRSKILAPIDPGRIPDASGNNQAAA